MDENKPRRRWLSFGIRDLLWAMVVVGLGIGWWADRQKLNRYRDALLKLRAIGFNVGGVLSSPLLTEEINANYEADQGRPLNTKPATHNGLPVGSFIFHHQAVSWRLGEECNSPFPGGLFHARASVVVWNKAVPLLPFNAVIQFRHVHSRIVRLPLATGRG